MELLLSHIEWVPVVVSTLVAFVVGMVWYSPLLFVRKWQAGLGQPAWQPPMWMGMLPQLAATAVFAVVMNVAMQTGQMALVVLFTIVLMGFIKANGFYSGKSMWAVSVEVLYILVLAVVLWAVNLIL